MSVNSKIVRNIILPSGYDITSQISCFTNISYINILKSKQYKNAIIIHMNVNVNSTKIVDRMIHFNINLPILTEKIDIISIESNVDLKFEIVKNKYEVDGNDKFLLAIYSTSDTYINKRDMSYHQDSTEYNEDKYERSRSRSHSRSYDRHRKDKDSKSHNRKRDKDSRSRSRERKYSRDRSRSRSPEHKRHRKYSRDRSRSRSPEHKHKRKYQDDLERIRNEIRKEYEEKERQQYAQFPIPYHSNHPMMPSHHMVPPPPYGYHIQQGSQMPAPPHGVIPIPPPPLFF
jgi:hypothetical protein